MNIPSREDLLGYMLGALDAEEQQQVQKAIDQEPQLEEQLLSIKSALAPLEVIDRPAGPPAGLARRTCQLISMATRVMTRDRLISQANTFPAVSANANANNKAFARVSDQLEIRHWLQPAWSRSDFVGIVVSACVLGAIVFPILYSARFNQRVTACQYNLTQIYRSLTTYAENHNGRFVPIPSEGPFAAAGAFAPILKDCGLVQDDKVFSCPGLGNQTNWVHIPSCEQIQSTSCPKQRHYYHCRMSGDYGYSLGYFEDGKYVSPSDEGRENFVLVADTPSVTSQLRMSSNHSGRGANCLFENGAVKFSKTGTVGVDSVYLNDVGNVAPGIHADDSVIASSFVPVSPTSRILGHAE